MNAPTGVLAQAELHRRFLHAVWERVKTHSNVAVKPLEVELRPPLPAHVRLYLFNATRPPGGRTPGEHKIQLIVPGQPRGARGSLDHSGGRIVLLAGYVSDLDVFVFWDSGLYTRFAYSSNVQVRSETVVAAYAGQIGVQQRRLRGTPPETVIAVRADLLEPGIIARADMSLHRLLGG